MTWNHNSVSVHQQAPGGSLYREFGILQFAGLNNKYAPMHIQDNQATDLMNVVFDELGAITKRNGYAQLYDTKINSNPITSLFTFYKSDGTKKMLSTSGNSIDDVTPGNLVSATWYNYQSKTFSDFKSTFAWTDIQQAYGWKNITSSLSGSGLRFTAATYYDKVYMLNGNASDGLMSWDGSNFTTVTGDPSPPPGQFVIMHKNRLYIAGDPNNTSRLYMSDLGLPESWPALNFIDVNTNDGDKITGLAEFMDSLVIFKERSIHVLRGTGPNNYVLMDVHVNRGTVSHWSIVNANNELLFLARDGVYGFDGKHLRLVSDVISGSTLGINGQTPWNQSVLNLACAIDYNHKYWLAVPEGTTTFSNNRVYVYDYIHQIWTRFDIPISTLVLYNNTLYSGDVNEGSIYQQDTGDSDNGNPINAYLTTKAFDFGAPGHFKSYKGLFFYAAQQLAGYSINVSYIGDFGRFSKTVPMNLGSGTPSQWGSMTWGASPWGAIPNVAARTTNIAGQSRYMQFQIQGNGIDQPFTFYGWVVLANVKRRLR